MLAKLTQVANRSVAMRALKFFLCYGEHDPARKRSAVSECENQALLGSMPLRDALHELTYLLPAAHPCHKKYGEPGQLSLGFLQWAICNAVNAELGTVEDGMGMPARGDISMGGARCIRP